MRNVEERPAHAHRSVSLNDSLNPGNDPDVSFALPSLHLPVPVDNRAPNLWRENLLEKGVAVGSRDERIVKSHDGLDRRLRSSDLLLENINT